MIVGSCVKLEYLDQNEQFASLMPLKGTIVGQSESESGESDWYMVDLNEPIEYQIKVGLSHQYKLLSTTQMLIRSRWKDQPIDACEATSVHIVLVDQTKMKGHGKVNIDDHFHICWGMCEINQKKAT